MYTAAVTSFFASPLNIIYPARPASQPVHSLYPCSRLGAGLLLLAYNALDELQVAGVPGVPNVPKPW